MQSTKQTRSVFIALAARLVRFGAGLASGAVVLQTGCNVQIDQELWAYQWLDFLRSLLVQAIEGAL